MKRVIEKFGVHTGRTSVSARLSRNVERPLFCAAQISKLLWRGVYLRLLLGVIHPGVFQVELARSRGRQVFGLSERGSSAGAAGEQRGQEARQSGKKAGERVLGFIEVGGKSGSGGERKVSFRSRRSLGRSLARSLAQQKRVAISRLRGSAVSRCRRWYHPASKVVAQSRSRDFSPPADVRREHPVGRYQNGRALRKLLRVLGPAAPPADPDPFSAGPRSRKGSFFPEDDAGVETPRIELSAREERKEGRKEEVENDEGPKPGNFEFKLG